MRTIKVLLFCLVLCGATFTAPTLLAASPAAIHAGIEPSSPDGGPSPVLAPSKHRGLVVTRDELADDKGALSSDPVLNVRSGLFYGSIADAVAAANAGDTLRVVAPAMIEGQVTIDRDLILEGADGEEIVFAGADTGSGGDDRAWFLVEKGVDLTVRDLTFNGNGFRIYQAFRHRGSGSFERVYFDDIRFEPSTLYQGTAIVAFGGPVDVRDSSFTRIGRIGVLYFGAGTGGSVAERNLYLGKGDGDFLDYGLEVGAGADVELRDNLISDCRGIASADGSGSAAIALTTFFGPGTAAVVESNQLLESYYGLALGLPSGGDASSADVRYNRWVDNVVAGAANFSSQPLDAERNWWGCNDGPGAVGCDALVTGVGSVADGDPWLVLSLQVAAPALIGLPLTLEGDLHVDSNGLDTSGSGTVGDGVPMSFAGAPGTIAPSITSTVSGSATADFTPDEIGPARVSVTVDHQTVDFETEVFDLPLLFIREELPAAVGTPLVVPVEFDGKGLPIAGLAFSLDLDPACLAFDNTDADMDGVPDSVNFLVPPDFVPEVFVDLGDADGELDFSLADVPPVAIVPDGPIVEVTFDVLCAPPPEIVPLPFSGAPAVSFGDTSGASLPGQSTDGSFRLLDGLRGDCNDDGVVDAGDFTACGLEIFDGDGDFWLDTPGGSFAGDPVGCDANADTLVDAGDVACKRRIASATICAEQASGAGVPVLEIDQQLAVGGGVARTEITLYPANRQLSSVVLALEIDPALLDPASAVVTPEPGVTVTQIDVGPSTLGLIVESTTALMTGAVAELAFTPVGAGQTVDGALSLAPTPALSFGTLDGVGLDGELILRSPPLFEDGFESGDTSAWSAAVP